MTFTLENMWFKFVECSYKFVCSLFRQWSRISSSDYFATMRQFIYTNFGLLRWVKSTQRKCLSFSTNAFLNSFQTFNKCSFSLFFVDCYFHLQIRRSNQVFSWCGSFAVVCVCERERNATPCFVNYLQEEIIHNI